MDCEKFEPLLLDELYEELDELTSAAVKRHVAGCARCNAALSGMKATRGALVLPIVPPPTDLEDRILAAAREAQRSNVVPLRSRMSRVLAVAGSWAMRPQTAMAAVFLLMIGTSAFLIRSKNSPSRDAAVAVTVAGEPAPTVAASSAAEALDDKAAAAAHGPGAPIVMAPPPAPSAVAMNDPPSPDVAPSPATKRDLAKDKADESALLGQAMAKASDDGLALRPAPTSAPIANAAAPAGAPDPYSQSAAPMKTAKRSGPMDESDPFSLGAAAFRGRNYAEATKQFDRAAQTGDHNAALWAAESIREGQGCAVALGRFVDLSQRAGSTWVGNEASLRAARCQVAMGQTDAAKERLNRLAQVPSHQTGAQQLLAELSSKHGGGAGAAGGAVAAPKRAAAPASPRPAAPVRAPSEAQEKKPADTANGF